MTIMEGWEVSPDRIDKFQKMIAMDPIGDPIITSKCKLDNANGLIIVSNNGFAWRIQGGSRYSAGKSKWIRWHDIANIIPIKYGQVFVEIKIRKKGTILKDKQGNYKVKKWKLTLRKNKAEQKTHYYQRLEAFNDILLAIYKDNKLDPDPPMSDSRI